MAAFTTALDIGLDPDEIRRALAEAGYLDPTPRDGTNAALTDAELTALAAWVAGDPPGSDVEPE